MDERFLAVAFGTQLKQARGRSGMSQDRLAERSGLSRTSVVNIEAGRQGVALATLYRLANALGVDPGDLLPRVPDDGATPAIAIGPETDDSSRTIRRVMESLDGGGPGRVN